MDHLNVPAVAPAPLTHSLESLAPSIREALLPFAVPQWLDEPLLVASLDRASVSDVRAWLQPYLRFEHEPLGLGRYVLDHTMRTQLLQELQDNHAGLYKTTLRHVFDQLLSRLPTVPADLNLVYEDEVMHHLDDLFFLLMDAFEMSALDQVLAATAAVPLMRPAHRHRLAYYQGCLQNEQGDYAAAEAIYTRLLTEPDISDQLRARAWTGLGISLDYRGLFDRAVDAYGQSRQVYAQLGDRAGEGKALKNIGIIYHQLGEYDRAWPMFQASYELFKAAGNIGLQGRALNELGYTAKELGRWQAALDYYGQALEIWRRLEDRDSEARIHNNLGEVQHLLGAVAEAQSHYEQALTITSDPAHSNKREAADILHNIGFLLHTQGQYEGAQSRYQQALAVARDINSPGLVSQIHFHLGDLWQRAGHPRKAYGAYREAIEALEAMRGQVKAEDIKISLVGSRQQAYEAMVLLCCAMGWLPRAFHYVERAKARAFLDLLAQPRVASATPTLAEGHAETPVTVREVQRALPPGGVLVEYFTTGVLEWGDNIIERLPSSNQALKQYLTPPARTLALVVTQTALHYHDLKLPPNTLRPNPATPPGGQAFLQPTRLRRLYDVLLAPLEAHLDHASVLYLVPHGPLHALPLQALQRPDGQSLLRENGPRLAYAPSASVLLRYCRRKVSAAPQSCLALGYNGDGAMVLRHAEDEAEAIARLWQGDARTGRLATKEVLREAGRYRIIHISCHGQFDPQVPLASTLHLNEHENLSASEILASLCLDAEFVTLSACETGISRIMRGDELIGLMRAFLAAGTPSLVVSQWRVEEVSTRIIMERFHRNLILGQDKATALQDAQLYIRRMTVRQLHDILVGYGQSAAEIEAQVRRGIDGSTPHDVADDDTPFDHPMYWAPFILVGAYGPVRV